MKEQRWWGMTFTFCEKGTISNIDFQATNITPNQDGIDLRAGCHDIVIENISGRTGDDTIALTALGVYKGGLSEMLKVDDKCEDIYNVIIRNIHSQVTGGHHIVRLLNHDGVNLYNILIDGIIDCSDDLRAKAALKIGDARYSHVRKAVLGETRNITARNIISRAKSGVNLGGTVADSYFSNIQQNGEYAIQSTDCEVENLLFDGVIVKDGGIYNFEQTKGKNVLIKNVINPAYKNANICTDSMCPEII
jgi:polygalacturonase